VNDDVASDRGVRSPSSASDEAGEVDAGCNPHGRDLLMGFAGRRYWLGLGSQSKAAPAGTLGAGDDSTQDCQPFYGCISRA